MGKKSSGTAVSMGTHSKSGKEASKEPEGEKGKTSSTSQQPKHQALSLLKWMKALPPKGITLIWIQYYEAEAKNGNSDYGKGFKRPPDFYERLMETYVSSEDNFFDILQQNPEACAVVFPDRSGAMKIIHAENHGKPIIIGLEGFGSMSEVKAVYEDLIVNRVSIGETGGKLTVPDLMDFISSPIDIDTSGKVDPVMGPLITRPLPRF